jgi:hypothetical protein
LKIIYLMPQILTLDRHVVTVAERIKAKQVCELDYGLNQGSKSAPKVTQAYQIKKAKGNGFSTGEKDLYREFGQLKQRDKQDELDAMERTKQFFQT